MISMPSPTPAGSLEICSSPGVLASGLLLMLLIVCALGGTAIGVTIDRSSHRAERLVTRLAFAYATGAFIAASLLADSLCS